MNWTFDDVMPFAIMASFAAAGWLLHRIGRNRSAAPAAQSGDGGETASLSWLGSSAGDSGDCGDGCGGCD